MAKIPDKPPANRSERAAEEAIAQGGGPAQGGAPAGKPQPVPPPRPHP